MKEFWNTIQLVFTAIGDGLAISLEVVMDCFTHYFALW